MALLHSAPKRRSPRRLRLRIAIAAPILFSALGAGDSTPAYAQPAPGEYVPEDAPQEPPPDASGDEYLDTDPSALADFRSTLDPHGSWIDDPTFGQIWVPNVNEVGPNFAPYVTDGSWAYDDDYVWMSDFEWGWVPFHYGRWTWASGRWGWVPGRVYAGAWVTWRVGADGYGYVGWGPLAPSFGWRSGTAFTLGAASVALPAPVVFVARDALFTPQVARQVVVGPQMAAIAAETRPYVHAETVHTSQGGSAARSVAHGPPLATLGVRPSAVVRVDPSNRFVARARALARPSTAQTLRSQGALGGGARAAAVRETGPRPGPGGTGRGAGASGAARKH